MSSHNTSSFLKVPPDSTGKALEVHVFYIITYENGTTPIVKDDILVGSVSGAIGTAHLIHGSTSSGTLYFR